MGLKEAIKGLFGLGKKEEEDVEVELPEVEEEIEELLESKKVSVEKEIEDPWGDFKAMCKEVGSDYREVISKAAWYYIEETGGVDIDDPVAQAKELAEALEKLDAATKSLTEPESVKKLKVYKDAFKEVAELKDALREIKGEKITAKDLLPLLTKLMK